MLTDPELLRRYAENRSEAAFAELVQRHLNFVYSVALRHVGGDAHHAKDVTQKVFADLARRAELLSRRPVLGGWLYRSAQYRAIDVVRSERRRRDREQKAEIMNAISSSPPSIDGDLLRPALDKAIGGLSDGDRDAVLLRFFEGKTFADIGASLRLTEDGARMRVDRALEKMRVALSRRGMTSTAAALAAILANQTIVAAPAGLAASVTGTAIAGSSGFSLLQLLGQAKATLGVTTALWVGGAVGLPAIGVAVYELREARRTQSALTAAAAEHAAQTGRLRALESSLRGAAQDRTELLAETDALKARLTAAAGKSDPAAEGRKLLAEFPQVRAILTAAGIPRVAERYHPFYRLANLTPLQVEQFENLTASTWADSVMVTPTGITAGTSDPAENQLRAILGDQGYEQLQNYNQMRQAYQFMDLVAAPVNMAGEPLSPGQIDRLAIVIADNSSLYRTTHDMALDHATFADALAAVDWDDVLEQAKAIFSPAQFAAAQGPLLKAQLAVAVAQARKGRAAAKTIP